MENKKKEVFVIGHRNPDTDSICAAIGYAALKNKISDGSTLYTPARAGQINEETSFVLHRFQHKAPQYFSDVRPQVHDVEVDKVQGVDKNISLKKAWDIMRGSGLVTLPVVSDTKLEGLITIGDIAYSDMDAHENTNLARANTSYSNIVETLEGKMIVGDINKHFSSGKVMVATANPDVLENYIDRGDMVILGNRYESQLCAIEMEAACLVIAADAAVSHTICKLADEHHCTIITTPYDTYTVARLINHSMPISYFMTKDNLIQFHTYDAVEDIQKVMAKLRMRDFPILDKKNRYYGMISRRKLLALERKQLILVDHNEKSQAVDGYEEATILEIIDHHRIGNLETMSPAYFRNQPVGCTSTIIYQMYLENQVDIEPQIAGLLCAAIISDTLLFRSPTCTSEDRNAAENLARIAGINMNSFANEMFNAGSNLKDKSEDEIFYQDFKKFIASDNTFGVGQITSMNADELSSLKERIIPYMRKAITEHGVDMLFFMLTNIMEESTELLFIGANSSEVIEKAFGQTVYGESIVLPKVVSRKKQLIPSIMGALQQ